MVGPTKNFLTGAHYKLIRALTGSVTLPHTHLLRDRLKATWRGEQSADSELLNEVKMLPIRIINSEAALTDQNLSIPHGSKPLLLTLTQLVKLSRPMCGER